MDDLDYFEMLQQFRNDLLTTRKAADLADVTPQAISNWVRRGHLNVATKDGVEIRDARGNPRYWRLDVAKAEHKLRKAARRAA